MNNSVTDGAPEAAKESPSDREVTIGSHLSKEFPQTNGPKAPVVVVVGASAGGVEALRELIAGFPDDTPAVVCVVLHLPARGVSYLPEILSRAGRLPARHPGIRERITTGTIYIAPPDEHLVIRKDHAELSHSARENHCRPSIDVLFRSAAEAFGPRTIGIILSGTRDDGALGLRLIRSRGGVAIVQDPREATFPGMPESALAIAGADFVLPVREMAAKVHELIESIDRSADVAGSKPATDLPLDLKSIAEVPTLLPSVFSCPDCGGVLWEQQDGDVTSFRCRIGHAYAPESLFDAQYETVEASVRMAIRVLEEQSDLAERLERRARALDKHLVADRFARERDEATGKAAVLRRLIDDVRELINAPGADVA